MKSRRPAVNKSCRAYFRPASARTNATPACR
jgi:hypothetical protein